MNWYLKGLENGFKDKHISGLTEIGDFVTGLFQLIKPSATKGYILVIKDKNEKVHNIFPSNIRKVFQKQKEKEKILNKVKMNFCGNLVDGVSSKPQNDEIKTRIVTTKEPHSLKKMVVVVPSNHIVHEDK
jgi:hypothetical protein